MLRKVLIMLLVLTGLGLLPLQAQTPPAAGEAAATKEEVARLVQVLRVKMQMEIMRDGMKAAMKSGAEDALKRRNPEAPPELVARVGAMVDEIFVEFPVDELMEAILPIYQKHLTKSDVEATLAFYSSPAGQKLLDKTPQMMAEAMEAGGAIARRQTEAMHQRIEERLDQMGPVSPAEKK